MYKAKAKAPDTEKSLKRKLMGIQEMLKLCNNGGLFGKLGQEGSFLHYPEGLLRVCVGNEIEILMLIEALELNGIQVVSSNTDGVVVMFPEEMENKYNEICAWWENKVGNTKNGKLEYTDFQCVWQESVNHYIGLKKDGSSKKKGHFLTEFQLNKNKSARIVPLALEAYFIEKKDPIQFIKNHDYIFDFCIAKKATGNMHYEEIFSDGTIRTHKKLIRYYVSNDGNVFKKRGYDYKGNPVDNHCQAIDNDYFWLGQPLLTYFNKYVESKDYNINYDFYIMDVLKKIDKIEKTKKAKAYADTLKPQIQTSLF